MNSSQLHRTGMRMAFRQLSTTGTTTKPIKLYGFPMSQPVRSVLLLCNSADIKYDFVLINALKGDHLKPDFRKIHPAGLLPAIEEDGLGVLGECSAILIYLAETRKLEQWYPSDPIRRAHINFFLSWHHGNTRLATSGLIRNKMFPPKGGTCFHNICDLLTVTPTPPEPTLILNAIHWKVHTNTRLVYDCVFFLSSFCAEEPGNDRTKCVICFLFNPTPTPTPHIISLPPGGGAEEAIAKASKSLSKSLMYLEGKLKTSKFVVAGDHPSIAGMCQWIKFPSQIDSPN